MTFLLILGGVVLLLFTGLPIFTGLGLFSAGLMLATQGDLGAVSEIVFGKLNTYLLVAIPLFTLMAHVMIRGRVVDDLYGTAHTLTRHLPGGLGIATVAACTVFAAISGSSVATALTIGAVAIPQMIRYGYDPKAAYGVVAAGGTLGILIPPSGPMVLYGVVSDTSIGGLFMAGVVPGMLIAGIFALWCVVQDKLSDRPVTREPAPSAREVAAALRRSFWALMLPVIVLGGMYLGVFTATEAAGVGALAALLVAVFAYRGFGWRDLWESAVDSCRTSSMLFMILAAAGVFGHALTKLRIPQEMVELVAHLGVGPIGFLLAVMLLLFVLGMFLETISIILITTPVVLPVMAHLNIHPIWYGILLTINLELALITPPVGMNLFTIKAITRAPMEQIIRGVMPYVLLLLLGLGLVMAFPGLALWLPGTMAFR
ncbi:TRAP transporter large permease [Azospirillum sp. RWY-5-1]|uniref:TRAP transporter large permease protein n=1 Tax=Azospirillum oleiclasticum TaxID=2735135 RepID=A0ABX2TB13_9PROT|nr:TRAP transporter large permease [Azospirillum oleiclasticum]NYZ14052.1 TRAP transporter large permease [Azospirillum oleiclasticum]NYZ21536.1 TRAP transporter large permease [Azospirillum oleiclasticum]